MASNDEKGFWAWFRGNTETPDEVRQGSVDSAGGDSPLVGIVPPSRPLVNDVVSPEQAYTLGTVFRSVQLICTMISQLDVGVYRNNLEIAKPLIIKTPDVDQTFSSFVHETVWSLALYGNAYWRVYGDPVASIVVLDPTQVQVGRDEKTGRKTLSHNGNRLNPDQFKHLRLDKPAGQLLGVGPVQKATNDIKAAFELSKFQSEWFSTSGVPTGVLSTDQPMNAETSKAVVEAWKDFVNSNGGTMILPKGLTYDVIRGNPVETQMLEVSRENNLNIARAFGIPAMHLGVAMSGTSTTYMNLEQTNIMFIQNTLVRYMNEIEEALTTVLPRGQYVSFKEEGLLRGDTTTKWGVLKTQVEVGYTSGNELRAAEGKEPLATDPIQEGDSTDN